MTTCSTQGVRAPMKSWRFENRFPVATQKIGKIWEGTRGTVHANFPPWQGAIRQQPINCRSTPPPVQVGPHSPSDRLKIILCRLWGCTYKWRPRTARQWVSYTEEKQEVTRCPLPVFFVTTPDLVGEGHQRLPRKT